MNLLKDFGPNRIQLANEFILESKKVAPDITLGLYLQFFGGIRLLETINLTLADIIVDKERSLKVRVIYPKTNRAGIIEQSILPSAMLWDCLESHIEYLNKINKSSNSLFINKEGRTMTDGQYRARFQKVRHSFINKLIHDGREVECYDLIHSNWGPSICRSIFTINLISMGLSPQEIAIARRDSNVNSCKNYIYSILY